MPNMNGTGPRGEGSKTGRGLGKCDGAVKIADNQNYRPGTSLGRGKRNCANRGLGLGRGYRNKASN